MHVIAGLLARSIVCSNLQLPLGRLSCQSSCLNSLAHVCLNNSSTSAAGPRSFASDSFKDTSATSERAQKAGEPSNSTSGGETGAAVQYAAGQAQHSVAAFPATQASNESTISSSASILQKYVSQELVTDVSSTINRLTGYENIDRLKARVATVDEALTDCKKQLQAAKLAYDQQLAHQTQLHREVTALLQRKSSWVPADVARFTELYAAEHETEKAVAVAKARYTTLSDDVELLQLKMVDLIRERYQQEQAWSDKIRRASTWWTWGLMGLHFASFVAVYTFLEPRKRQALTDAVSAMLQQHTARIDVKLSQLADAVPAVTAQAVSNDQARKQASDRKQQPKQLQQQQQQGSTGSQVLQQGSAAAAVELQQRVLQELERVQQQLQALTQQQQQQQQAAVSRPGTDSSANGTSQSAGWWQLPSRQWVSQQATAAGSAAARGWHALSSRSKEMASQFNPLQTLRGQKAAGSAAEGVAVAGECTAHSRDESAGSSSAQVAGAGQQQQGGSAAAAGAPSSHGQSHPQPQQQSVQQQLKQQEQDGVRATPQQPAAGLQAAGAQLSVQPTSRTGSQPSKTFPELLGQLKSSGAVVEVTKRQLAVIGAAASTFGAVLGAVLVLLLRPGGGASSSSSMSH